MFPEIQNILNSMCLNDELAEATNFFLNHKLDWKYEIELTIERLKKVERSLSSKEKELQEREMRLFHKERKMNLVKMLNKTNIREWDASDVYIWMEQLGNEAVDLIQYAQVFLDNHINGRRSVIVLCDVFSCIVSADIKPFQFFCRQNIHCRFIVYLSHTHCK